MSFVAKLALPLLLLAACGKDPVAPPSSGLNTPPETPTQVQDPTPVQPASGAAADPAREPVREDITANSAANKSAPQGVKGRALLPDGQPAVGVPVMLLENAMNDPLEMFLKNKSGKSSPPIARDVTAEDGSFYLGVPKAMQKVDLRILSDDHPELSKSPIQVSAGDWYDAGDLKFEVGLTVQGRVVNAQTKGPIAGATVFLSSSVRAHSMVVTPGRERGVAAVTDQSGYFRFTNAPKIGTVNLTAEAEGYASTNKLNQQIRADSPNDFTLEIEAGSTISGVVVDPNGKRVPGAKIMAYGLSVKTPQNETVLSDDNGEFRFPALRSGPYRLTTSARSFADEELAVALTGEDVKVVLQPRARVRLKVLTSKQRPVKSYRLSLKRAFPQNPDAIGNVLDFADRNISPRDYDGAWAVIGDMPTGDFKFQIMEKGHAKSLSPMFKVVQGSEEPVEVVVELTQGASIAGRVVDNYGQPVAGARVSSDMNAGLAAGTGLFDIFRSMIPEKHTTRQVTTDKDGYFRIGKLSFADYMVRVSHPKYCEGTAVDIPLSEEGQEYNAGDIALEPGARIVGVTTVGGVPAGQVKVVISMPTPEPGQTGGVQPGAELTPEQRAETAKRLFSAHVLSDGSGNYTMLKRVPPGTYKITAARHSAENPFGALLDMKESEQVLVIAPGQDSATVNFNLSNR